MLEKRDPCESSDQSRNREHDSGGGQFFHRLIEPPFLLAAITLVLLAGIWTTAWYLGELERTQAEQQARSLVPDVADTYEARVLRALRRIDSTLKLVRHSLGDYSTPGKALTVLKNEGLLPLSFIFTVSVTDRQGVITHSSTPVEIDRVSDRSFFRRARKRDALAVSPPRFSEELNEWRLSFGRPIDPEQPADAGIVMVTVPARYFVSGYQQRTLGHAGLLGLIGFDSSVRVMRTGDEVTASGYLDPKELGLEGADGAGTAPELTRARDGTERYLLIRKLAQYPLSLVVGVARGEQLAPAKALARKYLVRAALISGGVLVLMLLLGRMSWQLHRARARALREREERTEQVEYLAFHDQLTQLPNRAFFSQLLVREIQQSARYDKKFALLFLDLDGFKEINDSRGHEAGDHLLRDTAERLNSVLRDSDVVARLGGDEFVVIVPEVEDPANLAVVAQKILDTLARPFMICAQRCRVSASVGIALYPQDAYEQENLMKNADRAMYLAKEQGKNNYQYYADNLNADQIERLAMETSLRHALENAEFRLFFQAKQAISTGSLIGMEALLRWQHPTFGLIQPMDFIPQAEKNGLIVPIGRWVLNEACRQNKAWQEQGFPPLSVAVNLSARQFIDQGLLGDVRQALDRSGMEPDLLEVEITESMLMPDTERSVAVLGELRGMGVRVAIDDFGTGYSSLSSIREFPLTTIKVATPFVRNLENNPEDEKLMQAIIALGRHLGLTVIAEGVETEQQLDFLRKHSCHQFQGFYINIPVSAEEFAEQLSDRVAAYMIR